MWDWFLDLNVANEPFLFTCWVLSAAIFIYLLGKRPTLKWAFGAFMAVFLGALVGYAIVFVAVNVLDSFGGPVDDSVWIWVPAAFAGVLLAIANLWGSRWWRKLIAGIGAVVFVLTAVFSINAAYGLTPTIGGLLHISTDKPIPIPTPPPTDAPDPAEPLYQTWQPPADLPAQGTTGLVQGGIPNTNSGFPARPASIYLPPAALVENPPALPLVIFMMGQPGDPDPQYIAAALEPFAAKNKGLAPIALVIDQLSDPSTDPLCLDTAQGKVETYVMQDVVPWARANLHVLNGPKFWTVAGYSNGGQCSLYFGSKYPEVFGDILDISGEEYQGADIADQVLQNTFNGDQAAYDAVKPTSIMAQKGPYADTVAVFTVGGQDPGYIPGVQRNADAAKAAGMQVTYYEVPGAGHGGDALSGGLTEGFTILYPRLGLAPPAG
ncbi:esterase family protein [Agromyces sp. LHK192]|uniref:alpha/beta hydrolase n=1 Tax=Agromyces sp. LHK192 TaxID=2498704 RepID=UPI0013E3873B|nr:alpha/beta hydrolase-fold protein [Agromyces sp. LHK192]